MTSWLEGALCHTPGGVGLTLMSVPLLEEQKRRSGEPRSPCCFSGLWAKPSCSAAVGGPGATPSVARGSYLESSPWGFLLISVVDLPQRCVQFKGIVFFGGCVLILRDLWKLCWLPPGSKKKPYNHRICSKWWWESYTWNAIRVFVYTRTGLLSLLDQLIPPDL